MTPPQEAHAAAIGIELSRAGHLLAIGIIEQ